MTSSPAEPPPAAPTAPAPSAALQKLADSVTRPDGQTGQRGRRRVKPGPAATLALVAPHMPGALASRRNAPAVNDEVGNPSLLRCLEDLSHARDLPGFQRRLEDCAEFLGFPLVNATLVLEQPGSPARISGVRNSPPAFENRRRPRDLINRDPLLRRLQVTSTPFVWDQAMYVGASVADLWDDQAPFGFRTGLATAYHLPGGRHFLLGMDRTETIPKHPEKRLRMLADLQLLGAFAQDNAIRLLLPRVDGGASLPILTAREREILQWTLAGKSSDVTRQILKISLSTVNYHLRLAMDKLSAATKHQAAAKASALGLL
jgi:DNA-binding CsgD family transcriptional regulator